MRFVIGRPQSARALGHVRPSPLPILNPHHRHRVCTRVHQRKSWQGDPIRRYSPKIARGHVGINDRSMVIPPVRTSGKARTHRKLAGGFFRLAFPSGLILIAFLSPMLLQGGGRLLPELVRFLFLTPFPRYGGVDSLPPKHFCRSWHLNPQRGPTHHRPLMRPRVHNILAGFSENASDARPQPLRFTHGTSLRSYGRSLQRPFVPRR